ncbi:accessory gland-specific peptide 26Ab [Drosophila rhopaloa]|uniref:Accessory gland-specific peptide 26Ab n=1 Tax=Drosophila rhopaloa TaxID=1041015 RepID=A0A6P4EUA8_DRORH|nr:accessory gland-specific peptide 26Ab [Drosophila rhopaloa]
MNYIVLICIFSYICLWRFTEAAPFISIQSSSRSKSNKMVGGYMRTVYDYKIQDNVNDSTGRLIHSRTADFKSDFLSPMEQQNIRNQLIIS